MDQESIMRRARWILGFVSRSHSNVLPYRRIYHEVQNSQLKAAGPAEVLALAVWYFSWRKKFPTQNELVERDEYCADRLNRHMSHNKAQRYRVWKAIEIFCTHRQSVFESTPRFAQFFARRSFDRIAEKAFFKLDCVAQRYHYHSSTVTAIFDNMLGIDPILHNMLLEALGDAVWIRYKFSCSQATAAESIKANNTVWKIRNEHPWMGKNKHISHALNAFRTLAI